MSLTCSWSCWTCCWDLYTHTLSPLQTLCQAMSHPKDPIPRCERPGVVYLIPCASCNLCYIGQTSRSLLHCQKEHRAAVRSFDISSSALAQHRLDTGHSIDWDNSKVLSTQQHWYISMMLPGVLAHSGTSPYLEPGFWISLSVAYNCLLPKHQISHSTP